MAKIALNTHNLSVNDKITKGKRMVAAAGTPEGSSVLGTPVPVEVGLLEAKTSALSEARDQKAVADNAVTSAVLRQAAAEKEWDAAVAAYGRMGESKSEGVPAKIVAIGLDVAATGAPVGRLPAPTGLHATTGDRAGQTDLACNSVAKARGYIWQVCAGDPTVETNWHPLGQGTKSRYTAKNLPSGTKPWFRVAAFGTGDDNQSPWSDPALGLVA